MQMLEKVNKVDSSFGEGQRLTIAATATAMKVLSKNLYSDPIRAVLREVGTNAADAHVSAGLAEKPFEVHLPTYANQTLRIRDWGNGIHPDKVIDIFATYFSSTKTDDNSVTGCLGLGSKSPLAIADQFTVEIWFEGFYYVWNIYKDEDSFPAIPNGKPSLVQSTTEPSGVQITIPVSDTRRFEEMAQSVYQSFNPLPNVYKGQNKVEIKKPLVKNAFTSCWFEEGQGCFALMGNICYPINSSIAGLEGYADLGNQSKVIIPFAIGELSFSASRESLEYERRVLNTLKSKYKQILSEFEEEVQKQLDLEKSPLKAVLFFNAMPLPYKLKAALQKTATYKGALLTSYYSGLYRMNYEPSVMKVSKDNGYGTMIPVGQPLLKIDSSKRKYHYDQLPSLDANARFYYNDSGEKRGLVTRLAPLWGNSSFPVYLLTDDVDIDKWLHLNHMVKEDLYKISEVEKVPSNSVYDARRKAGVFKIKGGRIQKEFWAHLNEELPEEAYYLVKKGDKFLIKGKEYFPSDWERFLSLGIFPTNLPIYGVSKSYLKNFDDWTNLEDPLLPVMELRRAELELALANESSSLVGLVDFWPNGQFKDKLVGIKKNLEKMGTWKSLFSMFGVPLVHKKDLKINEDEILKKYPMLSPLIDYYKKPSVSAVQKYISDIGDVV